MKAAIVGGTGFLGAHLAAALVAGGAEVRVLGTRAESPSRAVDYVRGEMSDPEAVARVIKDADHVFHFAWTTVPQTADDDPGLDAANLVGGLVVLEAARASGVRSVVFPSSGGTVYGPQGLDPVSEQVPAAPACTYGVTKVAFENHLETYRRRHGLDARILRIASVYGPGQPGDRPQGLVGVLLNRVLTGAEVTIFGDGTEVRDFVHVDDVVACCLLAASRSLPVDAPRVFNVGTGTGHSVREVLAAVEAVTGIQPRVSYRPRRECDVATIVLDSRRAGDVLGWRPRLDFAGGLRSTWAAMRPTS